jgi:hypothetical protein
MLSTSFLQLHTATYEWGKSCPRDMEKELKEFFTSKEFLDRPNVFYKGKFLPKTRKEGFKPLLDTEGIAHGCVLSAQFN